MHVEVNAPDHIAHGMRGHVVSQNGDVYTVDVDGMPIQFYASQLLFIRYRVKAEPRIDYWLRNFFWFVIGVAFGALWSGL